MRSLRLEAELEARIERAAAKDGVSVSEFIRRAAAERADLALPERAHQLVQDALPLISMPMATTWPVLTEAMYFIIRPTDARGREALWRLVLTDRLIIAELSRSLVERAAQLIAKYADTRMDLADATLVALAEQTSERRIFTLDADFAGYRLHGRTSFQIIPG